jgi:hypothetical protein
VRVTLLHGVEGGNRRIRRFFCGVPICWNNGSPGVVDFMNFR